jgi:hypothetical protein
MNEALDQQLSAPARQYDHHESWISVEILVLPWMSTQATFNLKQRTFKCNEL